MGFALGQSEERTVRRRGTRPRVSETGKRNTEGKALHQCQKPSKQMFAFRLYLSQSLPILSERTGFEAGMDSRNPVATLI